MIFEKTLMPNYLFGSFADITAEFLENEGISALLCDIDNTLVTYDDPEPTEKLSVWFDEMAKAGVKIAFISNNSAERVELFNRKLGYIAYADSGKPSTNNYAKAVEKMGIPKNKTAVLGDQLLTDSWAAHNFGVRAIIVPPIKDKTSLFFRFKRLIEVPYMKKARKHLNPSGKVEL